MPDSSRVQPEMSLSRGTFILAAWFGLAGGLLEGATLFILQLTGSLHPREKFLPVDLNILWVSPVVDLLLFAAAACLLLPGLWLLRRRRWQVVATTAFATLACYASLGASGRIRERGVILLALGLGVVTGRWMGRNIPDRMGFFRRSLVPLLLVVLLVSAGITFGGGWWQRLELARLPAPRHDAPNILLIVLDTVRADRLSSYGYPRPTTPFLDEFAREAVLFENAVANSSWSLPSHASLFTGRQPHEHGAALWYYDGRFPTLAQELARKGFATTGIVANGLVCTWAFGLARGFQHWENIFISPADAFLRTAYGRKFGKYSNPYFRLSSESRQLSAREVNRRFLRWLDNRPDRPFFAFLNYMETHEPYTAPREFALKFSEEPDQILSPAQVHFRSEDKDLDEASRRQLRNDSYDAALAYLDSQLRVLFDELRRRNLEQNLLVVITSDHGTSLGEHGLFQHRSSLYREQIHVPLLIRFPGSVPAGQRVRAVVGLDSLPATILDLMGFDPGPFPGDSLVPCWSAQKCSLRPVLGEVTGGDWPGVRPQWPIHQGWVRSLVTSEWHLLVQQTGKVELYDWASDPLETSDLSRHPETQSIVHDLLALLETMTGVQL